MLDKLEYLDDGEARYPMAFTLNVMESAEEEYGGVESWAKLMDQKEPSYKALKFMILEIINEGIDIQNEKSNGDKKIEPLTSKQAGRLITRVGFEECGMKIFKLIQESLPKGDNTKNAVPTKGRR